MREMESGLAHNKKCCMALGFSWLWNEKNKIQSKLRRVTVWRVTLATAATHGDVQTIPWYNPSTAKMFYYVTKFDH